MKTEQKTILKAIEDIHRCAKNSKLNLDKYKSLNDEIKQVSNYFDITSMEAVILSSVISLSILDEIVLKDLIKFFGMENINFLIYHNEFQNLIEKNIIEKKSNRRSMTDEYFVKPFILDFILSNEQIPSELIQKVAKEDSFHEFLGDIDKLSDRKDIHDIEYNQFIYEFKLLFKKYDKFKLVSFADKNLDPIESFVFFDVIIDAIAAGENNFASSLQSTVDDFTNHKRNTLNFITNFLEGKTNLNKLDLIEKDSNEFSNRHKIQLTMKALKMLQDMEGIKIGYTTSKNDRLIYPEKIQKIKLLYNTNEIEQLEPIIKSMSQTAFTTLQKKLHQKNMPMGVTALLYGFPGTGKTETVFQLAKRYNRAIFKVDIAETKSMWFGESQKLVKKIFTDYYSYKKQEKVCPILLFNEADAIIGKRKNAGSTSTSDTENAIQNILLEELENFDGILFATSNLVDNLDSAFERRFLFKIKFDKPSPENATKIWQYKLPVLSKKEAIELANKYKFSGGEMENIARKCLMEEVVMGKKVTFDKVMFFCENEKWNSTKNGNASKIGF